MTGLPGSDDGGHASTIAHFTELASRFGSDPRAVDWGSMESQALRFSILSGVGPFDGASILDVGCGQAALARWLRGRASLKYVGVDIVPVMVQLARTLEPGAEFHVMDILRATPPGAPFDFVLASGIFYKRAAAPKDFMRAMIRRMWELCRQGAAFNSLSTWSPERDSGEYYADPLETIEFCRTITPWVTLRHDYHPRDFTILMRRGRVA